MDYILHIFILFAVYSVLSTSLDLVVGHTGLLSLAHAAFYGIGAYTSAVVTVEHGASFVVGVLAGMGISVLVSLVVSLPSFRLRDDYFVIASFGFQMILFSVFNNWMEVTNGPLGIPGVPPPSILGITFRSKGGFLLLATFFASASHYVVVRLTTSQFGRILHAIREDEVFARALGKNTLRFKTTALAVSAALASTAGSLYAHYVTYIDPTSFTVMESVLILSMVIIGGAGSTYGPILGAAILVVLPEVLRVVGLSGHAAANVRELLYGGLLIVMMLGRPRGIVGRYDFSR